MVAVPEVTKAKIFRVARGLRLRDVQEATGIDEGSLSRFERGLGSLTRANLTRLGEFYGVHPAVLALPASGEAA